ncbi:hypothetical protein D3C81_1085750 [compost metagenome]
MKRWGALGLLCLWMGLIQPLSGAEAQSVNETVYSSEASGELNVASSVYEPKIGLSLQSSAPVTLNMQQPPELEVRVQLSVYQENTASWQYSVQLSNFTIRQQRGEGAVQAEVPAAYASYMVQGVTAEDAHTLPESYAGTFATGVSQTVMQAGEDEGKGQFGAELLLHVVLPPSVQVVSVEGNSDLNPGQTIGLLAGEYKASLVSTLVSGI